MRPLVTRKKPKFQEVHLSAYQGLDLPGIVELTEKTLSESRRKGKLVRFVVPPRYRGKEINDLKDIPHSTVMARRFDVVVIRRHGLPDQHLKNRHRSVPQKAAMGTIGIAV